MNDKKLNIGNFKLFSVSLAKEGAACAKVFSKTHYDDYWKLPTVKKFER